MVKINAKDLVKNVSKRRAMAKKQSTLPSTLKGLSPNSNNASGSQPSQKKKMSFKLPPEILEKFKKIAAEKNVSLTQVVAEAFNKKELKIAVTKKPKQ